MPEISKHITFYVMVKKHFAVLSVLFMKSPLLEIIVIKIIVPIYVAGDTS